MSHWLQILVAGVALVMLAPAIAWAGARYGKDIRGNLALGAVLLGLGEPADPPPKEKVEAAEPGKDLRSPGAPPGEGR